MKTSLKTLILISAFGFTSLSHSAAYIKFDGVDGESKAAQQEEKPKRAGAPVRKGMQDLKANNNDGEKALLLPAVQKAREAARSPSKDGKSKGKVEASWKVEEGEK